VRASGAGHRGGTLTLLTSSGDLHHLDPADAYSQTEWPIVAITNDGLVGFRRAGGSARTKLVPDLAVSLPVPTDGGRTYTFHLRPGIRYSTGAVVRPADFRRAIERALLHPLGPGFYFAEIVGAQRCLARPKAPCDLSQGIVTDPAANTVTFHLTAPDSDFLYKLQLPAADAVPAGTPLHDRGFVPATGPYEIASFDPKRGLRLVRNPRFREWSRAAQPSGFPNEIVERVTGSGRAHRRGPARLRRCCVYRAECGQAVTGSRVRADGAHEPARAQPVEHHLVPRPQHARAAVRQRGDPPGLEPRGR
jgi:peptide/nickel transport system substrate-binding protein